MSDGKGRTAQQAAVVGTQDTSGTCHRTDLSVKKKLDQVLIPEAVNDFRCRRFESSTVQAIGSRLVHAFASLGNRTLYRGTKFDHRLWIRVGGLWMPR